MLRFCLILGPQGQARFDRFLQGHSKLKSDLSLTYSTVAADKSYYYYWEDVAVAYDLVKTFIKKLPQKLYRFACVDTGAGLSEDSGRYVSDTFDCSVDCHLMLAVPMPVTNHSRTTFVLGKACLDAIRKKYNISEEIQDYSMLLSLLSNQDCSCMVFKNADNTILVLTDNNYYDKRVTKDFPSSAYFKQLLEVVSDKVSYFWFSDYVVDHTNPKRAVVLQDVGGTMYA